MTPEEFHRLVPPDELIAAIGTTSTPCYLFFARIMELQVERLRAALGGGFEVHYAVKANPHPEVLRTLQRLGTGADVASVGELRAALDAGFDPETVEFSGPGKTRAELERAIEVGCGCVNVESLGELDQLIELAEHLGKRARVGLRINPKLSVAAGLRMSGATQFGVDEADVEPALVRLERAQQAADFLGLHVHVGSQILDADTVLAIFRAALDLAARVRKRTGLPLRKLNFGGGWGVTYFDGQAPLDLDRLRAGVADLIRRPEYAFAVQGTSLIVEPGRFLVAESGVYVARILYLKESGGERFAIIDGGMHHNYLLAGGMGQVILRNFFLTIVPGQGPRRSAAPFRLNIAGSLCTPQDLLARGVRCDQQVVPGDHVVFFNSGAYGLTASPVNFLGHAPATERVL